MRADPQTKQEITGVMDRMNEALRNRRLEDMLAAFLPHDTTVMIGAEAGEIATGPAELQAFFERLFSREVSYGFRWASCDVCRAGDVVWITADGMIVSSSAAGTYEHPYRMTGVFRRTEEEWRCAQFHGSEPAG